jgi:hypothetical protein
MSLSNHVRRARAYQINDQDAESRLLGIALRAGDKEYCACSMKELARQIGLSVREAYEKLRLLRRKRVVWTFRGSDGYAFFLNVPLHKTQVSFGEEIWPES